MLRELGHPIHNVTKALGGKRIDPEAVKKIRRLASEVVKFSQLESWQLVCEKPDNGVQHHAAEALAKSMHKPCCQAARKIGICIVKKISISFITKGELQLK
jgi:coenzyme F420-reducing hydrogenase alpha subunit